MPLPRRTEKAGCDYERAEGRNLSLNGDTFFSTSVIVYKRIYRRACKATGLYTSEPSSGAVLIARDWSPMPG